MSAEYKKEISNWRAGMETNLRADYSWLSLAGLFWLEDGTNFIGSGPDCTVRLPERFPERVGTLISHDGEIRLSAGDGETMNINDQGMINEEVSLHADISGMPDFVFVQDLRMMLIERGGNSAIRVWDPQSEVRKSFRGRDWFQVDPDFRIKAKIFNYEPAKSVIIDDILGFQQEGKMDAQLRFTIDGKEMELDAQRIESGAYYVIFSDKTAGIETYNSGRYMVTEIADGDNVVIDFNRAYNPPCVFTIFATCPLPRPENVLGVKIKAGEKLYSNAN